MEHMTFIHANSQLQEQSVLYDIVSADMEIKSSTKADVIDNTWSLTISEKTWEADPINEGDYIYCPGPEWGGPVTLITHSTGERTITLQGPTWRGLLFQKRIYPPSGEAYLSVENKEANQLISLIIGSHFGTLFHVPSTSTTSFITDQWRYESFAAGLHKTMRDNGLRLDLSFDNVNGYVVIQAKRANDLTNDIEISQDYNVDFTSTQGNIQKTNHCLALGTGELEQRQVLNVYRVGDQYYTTQPATLADKDIRTIILDYPNAENADELLKSALDKLQEGLDTRKIVVDDLNVGTEAELGDLIKVRDRLTGMSAKSEIVGKILTIEAGRTRVDIDVETTMKYTETPSPTVYEQPNDPNDGVNILYPGDIWIKTGVVYTWGDLATMTWAEVGTKMWGQYTDGTESITYIWDGSAWQLYS